LTQSAVAFRSALNGREQKTDGLWSHLGSLLLNTLTVTGRASLPAGSAQALVGNWYAASGQTIPTAAAWYESEIRANYTIQSSPLVRFEFCITLNSTNVGSVIYVGLGIDDVLTWASIGVVGFPAAGLPQMVSGFMYHQGHPLGAHHANIWLYTNSAGKLDAGANSGLWVTEQRA